MNTAETSGAVVYNFPPHITERQRYVNFLRQYEPNRPLLVWFISPSTGRLLGVWNINDKITWSSFNLVGKNFIFYGTFQYPDWTRDLWNNMKGSPAFGIMPAMKEYLGITRHADTKPEGRIVYFHRPGVVELREFSCEELICTHSAFLCAGISVKKAGLYMAIVFLDPVGTRTVLAHRIFSGRVADPYGGAWEVFYQWAIKSNMVFEGPDGTRLQAQYSIFAGDAVDVSAETIDGFVSRFAAPVFARGVVWGKLADDLIQHPGYIDISGVAFRDKIRDVKTAAGITATMIDEAALIAALASFWHCIRTQSAMCEARKQKHGGQQEKELPKRIPKVLTARPGCPFPQKTRSERPKGVDELMRYLSDDQPDFILVGFWDRGIETEAFFIPATGPRHTLIFWYKKHWQTGNFQGCCLGRAIRKAINWDDPDCYCTDALHLLPPNPDHRAEYLARKEKAMRVAR